MKPKPPFERIVAEHGATVWRVCRALLGAGADADDAWSETFLAALQAWPALPATTNMEAWLVRVAHNKAVDLIRRRSRRDAVMAEAARQAATRTAPVAKTSDLWAAVLRLPCRQRQAVAYHYLAGFSHAEVAQLIGGTTEAARRAAFDGIRSLRRQSQFTKDDKR